jgi:hypothetical protein
MKYVFVDESWKIIYIGKNRQEKSQKKYELLKDIFKKL